MTFFVPYGIAVAASVMIGSSLGKGWSKTARKVVQVVYVLVVVIEIFLGLLLVLLRNYIPLIFTQEPAVIELAASIFPVAAGYQILDGLAAVSGGILRGCGKQKIGAIGNFVGYIVFGLSASALLAFLTPLRTLGLWVGVAIALFVTSAIAIIVVLRINWERETVIAKDRLTRNMALH